MFKPKTVLEDNLTEAQKKELHLICEVISRKDMSSIDKARAISLARSDAQKKHSN